MTRTLAAALLSLATAACVDDPDLGEVEQHAGPGGGFRGNGEKKLGSTADTLPGLTSTRHLSTATSGVKSGVTTAFSIDPTEPTCLVATIAGVGRRCADAALLGYEFTASGTSTSLRIVSATSFTPAATPLRTATGYVVETKVGSGAWTRLCPSGTSSRLAFPIAGEVYKTGVLDTTATTRLTWACSDVLASGAADPDVNGQGAFAKVMNWGYLPGSGALTTTSKTPRTVSRANVQAAAAHMTNADYCYQGTAATYDGTRLAHADLLLGNSVPEATGIVEPSWPDVTVPVNSLGLANEAAWTESKPTSPIAGARTDTGSTVCLTKLRWATLPIGAICNSKVVDPRITGNRTDFCDGDTNTYQILADRGAVLVSASMFNEAPLRIWALGGASGDKFTTSMGFESGALGPDEPPRSGYVLQKGTTYGDVYAGSATQSLLGTIVTTAGRDVWVAAAGATAAGTFAELRSCRNPTTGDRVTATAALIPATYGDDCQTEGYVWTVLPTASGLTRMGVLSSDFAPLYRYTATSLSAALTTEYLTTNKASGLPVAYGSRTLIGYIRKARTY